MAYLTVLSHTQLIDKTFHLCAHYAQHTSSFCFRLLSMSENPEAETVESICALKASSKEVTECMSGWLTFIQVSKVVKDYLNYKYFSQLFLGKHDLY